LYYYSSEDRLRDDKVNSWQPRLVVLPADPQRRQPSLQRMPARGRMSMLPALLSQWHW
jgi:hypothetical protein